MWSLEGNKLTVQQKDNSWMRNAEYVKRLYKKSDFVLPKQESQKKLRETDSLQQEQESLQGVFLTERDRQFAARNRSRFRVSS